VKLMHLNRDTMKIRSLFYFFLLITISLQPCLFANQTIVKAPVHNNVVDTKKEKEKSFFTKKVKLWIAGGITALATLLAGGYLGYQHFKKLPLSELEQMPFDNQVEFLEVMIESEPNLVSLQDTLTAYSGSKALRNVIQSKPVQKAIMKKRVTLLNYLHDEIGKYSPQIAAQIPRASITAEGKIVPATVPDLSNILLNAAKENAPGKVIKLLVENGANVNIRDWDNSTPVIYAISNESTSEQQKTQTVLALVSMGADLTVENIYGKTATYLSYRYAPRLTNYLAKESERQKLKESEEQLPIKHMSITQIRQQVLQWNSEVADKINKRSDLSAVLLELSERGSGGLVEYLVKMLMDNGADINAQDSEGKTAIMIALEHHNDSLAKLLLDLGADLTIEDNKLKTAYGYTSIRTAPWLPGTDEELRNLIYKKQREQREMKAAQGEESKGAFKRTVEKIKREIR